MKNKITQQATEEPLRLWFNFIETAEGGETISEEPYSDRTDEYREVTFHGCYRNGPDGLVFESTSVEVSKELYEAEKIYLVVVRYQDGDTFGVSYGNWKIVDVVATEEEAKELEQSIRAETYNKDGYNCWEGYFNRLENVEIHEFPVQEKAPGKVNQVWSSIIRHF